MTPDQISPAYCPNCGIDVLSNPGPERPFELERLDSVLYELRGYCDCGVVSYWSVYVYASARPQFTPVLRLAAGTDQSTGKLILEIPPRPPPPPVAIDWGCGGDMVANIPIRFDYRMPKDQIALGSPTGLGYLIKNIIA